MAKEFYRDPEHDISFGFDAGDQVYVLGRAESEAAFLPELDAESKENGFMVIRVAAEDDSLEKVIERNASIMSDVDEVLFYWDGADESVKESIKLCVKNDYFFSFIASVNIGSDKVKYLIDVIDSELKQENDNNGK